MADRLTQAALRSKEPIVIVRETPVATLVINNPAAMNGLTGAVRGHLMEALDTLEADKDIHVVVIAGAGEEAFSGGFDMEEMALLTPYELSGFAEELQRLYDRLARFPKPTIAAIKGLCVSGGFELSLSCDLRIARTDARFGLPSIQFGVVPNGVALRKLARTIGEGPARTLALTGGMISAERAFSLGLVSNVAPIEDFDMTVAELARHLANVSPFAAAEVKALFDVAESRGDRGVRKRYVESLERCFTRGSARDRLRDLVPLRKPPATLH